MVMGARQSKQPGALPVNPVKQPARPPPPPALEPPPAPEPEVWPQLPPTEVQHLVSPVLARVRERLAHMSPTVSRTATMVSQGNNCRLQDEMSDNKSDKFDGSIHEVLDRMREHAIRGRMMVCTESTTIDSPCMTPREWVDVLNTEVVAPFTTADGRLVAPPHAHTVEVQITGRRFFPDDNGYPVKNMVLFTLCSDRQGRVFYTFAKVDELWMDASQSIRVVLRSCTTYHVTPQLVEWLATPPPPPGWCTDLVTATCPEVLGATAGLMVGATW